MLSRQMTKVIDSIKTAFDSGISLFKMFLSNLHLMISGAVSITVLPLHF